MKTPFLRRGKSQQNHLLPRSFDSLHPSNSAVPVLTPLSTGVGVSADSKNVKGFRQSPGKPILFQVASRISAVPGPYFLTNLRRSKPDLFPASSAQARRGPDITSKCSFRCLFKVNRIHPHVIFELCTSLNNLNSRTRLYRV